MGRNRIVNAYLRFLLRHRAMVAISLVVSTFWFTWFSPLIFTNFFDLYPPRHPYVQLYNQYRLMFGTANTLLMVVEARDGTIFDDPETIRKVDRITLALLHDIPGVNGEQVLSITHPKLKTTLTASSGIKTVPLTYPRLPETARDLEFFKQKVYATEGVKGFFVSEDDTATLITAGFWEEHFDLIGMWRKIQELVDREEDEKTRIYVTGIPILFAYFFDALHSMKPVFLATGLALAGLLWVYFRTLQGVAIPMFSGLMSAIWGLGFAGLCGFNLDPLVLVVPALITARALSHSVQSMERYHEEYARLGDKHEAIRRSYTELFPPAMVAIASDGLAILTIAVASIPIMQKLAFVASFWIISIFMSVVTLHPIILSYARPPEKRPDRRRSAASGAGLVVPTLVFVFWARWGQPLDDLRAWAAASRWLEPATVALLIGVAGVVAYFLVRSVAERALAFVKPPILRGGAWAVRKLATSLTVVGVAFLAMGQGWLAPPYVLPTIAAVMLLAVAWRRFGIASGGVYMMFCAALVRLSRGTLRYFVAVALCVVLALGYGLARQLKVGDTTPGAALLYEDHPYNVAFDRVNDKFVGASQLVIIAEGREPGAIRRASTLHHLDLFGRYMGQGEGAGGSLTATTLLKKVFRTFHEGDPKWEMLPTQSDHVGQLFFLLTSATRRGEMDRFFDTNLTNATIAVFYKDYNHTIIHDSIDRAKTYIREYAGEDDFVRFRLAGGLVGLLAAVNEEVEWSYRVNICLILLVVLVLSTATYGAPREAMILALLGGAAFAWWQLPWIASLSGRESALLDLLAPVVLLRGFGALANLPLLAFLLFILWSWRSVSGALIVMAPSLVAQPLSEAVMYLMGIDLNISSLPVAAVGIGIGIDYGYYVLSRIKEEYAKVRDYDEANRRALQTTGRAVLFTGTTLVVSIVFWLFFPMKFQAEMALLLGMLLVFHLVGALVVIPAMVSLVRPRLLFDSEPAVESESSRMTRALPSLPTLP